MDDVVVHVYPCQLMPHITQSGDLDGQCRTWMLLAYMYVVVSFDVWDRALINGVDVFHIIGMTCVLEISSPYLCAVKLT